MNFQFTAQIKQLSAKLDGLRNDTARILNELNQSLSW